MRIREKLQEEYSSDLNKAWRQTDIHTDVSRQHYKLHWLQAAVELKNKVSGKCSVL